MGGGSALHVDVSDDIDSLLNFVLCCYCIYLAVQSSKLPSRIFRKFYLKIEQNIFDACKKYCSSFFLLLFIGKNYLKFAYTDYGFLSFFTYTCV